MKYIALVVTLLALPALGGCVSGGGGGSAASNWAPSGFRQSSDTLGTQRRMDVYGGATAPVLPTMGTPGYGK